jgi:hypothetical protein
MRLGGGGRRIDRIFRGDVELPAHDAAGRVDFFLRHAKAELGIGAERAEKTGQRRQMADFDLLGLAADDGRKSDRGCAGKGSAGFQQSASAVAGHHRSPPKGTSRRPARNSPYARM